MRKTQAMPPSTTLNSCISDADPAPPQGDAEAAVTSAATMARKSGAHDPALVRQQLTCLELTAACIVQSSPEYFVEHMPVYS